ncbi:MAG: chromosome segregation protein SMC [Bacillota bacterium]
MRLERLEIAGFKSFSEPVTAEFPEKITVVVGPNGSGKSNIVDAVRWVLGEQSAAGLRCSRMDELIFSGSERRRRLSLAEVRAEFAEHGGEALTIARRLDRSGRSEYLINGRRCRLRDVQEIFLDTGLGRGSYAIIGQGEVQRIIDARGDEMRSYLEEVAGVSRYRLVMRETERALLESEECLQRYTDMMNLRIEYLRPLREQAKRARLHRILSGREAKLRRALVLEDLRRTAAKLEENRRRDAELDAQLAQLDRREDQVQREYSRLSEAVNEEGEWIELLELGQRSLQESAGEVRTRLAVVSERLSSTSDAEDRASRALEDVRRRLSEQRKGDDEGPVSAEDEARLEQLRRLVREQKTRIEEVTSRLDRAEGIVRRSVQIAGELKLRERDTEREMRAAERELGDCFGRIARDGDELRELEAEGQQAESTPADAEMEDGALQQIDQQLAAARARLKSHQVQRDEERRRLEVVSDRLARWEGRIEALRQMAGEEVAAAADQSAGDASLLGRMGVPKGWEGAVELALGPWLSAVVVAFADGGDLSAESLILADVIGNLPDSATVDQSSWMEWLLRRGCGESIAGWLDEMVDFGDPDGERAGRHFCSRFLVVEDPGVLLELAEEIWSEMLTGAGDDLPRGPMPWIVTPEGEVADLAGAVCLDGSRAGGGLEPGPSPVQVQREIRRLSIGLRECRAELKATKTVAASAERQWQEQLEQVRELEDKRRQLAASREGRRRQEEISERQAQRQLRRMEGLRKQREQLSERVTELQRDKANMERDLVRLAEARSHLAGHRRKWTAIVERTREQLSQLQREAEQARYEEITLRERVSATKRRTEQVMNERAHLERQQARWEGTVEECRAEIRVLRTERGSLAERARGFSEALERTRRRLAAAREGRRKASSELNEVRRERSNLQRSRGEVERALNGVRVAGVRAQAEFDIAFRRAEEMGVEPADVELEGERMSESELARFRRSLSDLEGRRRQLEPINPLALDEFRREKRQVEQMREQRRDILESLHGMRRLCEVIDARLDSRYSSTLRRTSAAFNQTFTDLFGGGHAEIKTRGADPREADVVIRAQPPGKRLARLSLLSGGERALAGIAFLFALQQMRPSPVCVFDEIDAALDDANVERFVNFLRLRTNDIQYLLVTHQKKTMEAADTLHGVTMSEPGVSELVSVRLEDVDTPEYVETGQGGSR